MSIHSEIDFLEKVLVHRPGVEHKFILPSQTNEILVVNDIMKKNPDFILFDDIIDHQKIGKEHDDLSNILNTWTDGNCFYLIDLLLELFTNNSARLEVFHNCLELEKKLFKSTTISNTNFIKNLSTIEFVNILISGRSGETKVFNYPLPNFMFTRDIGVVLGNSILISNAHFPVRKRENIISKYLIENHQLFKRYKKINFKDISNGLSIEGGDVMVFNDKIVIIGISQRTPLKSVEILSSHIFNEGFDFVIGVELPKKREVMHLDTVLTRASDNECIIYPPLFNKKNNYDKDLNIYLFKSDEKNKITRPFDETLLDLLGKLDIDVVPINCGGEKEINQKREQWTEGANCFALAPGKIIGYKRNYETINELIKRGYKQISVDLFLNNSDHWISTDEKFIIVIDGSELVRGRGGMRCLTMPIKRRNG